MNQFNVCPLTWMIHSRFSNNRVKRLSTWKISSSEIILRNGNKNHNNSYKRYTSTNQVIIPNGVSFWFWFWNLSKNKTFPGRETTWLSRRNTKRSIQRNKTTPIYIAIVQLIFLNDSLWVLLAVFMNIFSKMSS